MKVAILGGGPAGLYLSILLKRWGVTEDISVFEQNPKDATYGFGVGVADGALHHFAKADAQSHDAIQSALYRSESQDFESPHGELKLKWPAEIGTITRLTLLQVLQGQCDDLGIKVQHETRINSVSEFDNYDLVVAADGANSVIREELIDLFGCKKQFLQNRFAWYGLETALTSALRYRRHGDGVFIAHYYPYTEDMSTFLVEVDRETWEDTGFGNKTDAERKAISEDVFADVLDGLPLVENKSNWTQFQTIDCERWVTDRVALIGDAQYRAHFSIGSGTRLAMEDSIALATAMKETPANVALALSNFEAARRPVKRKLMGAARKSYLWYDDVRKYIDLPLLEFGYNFLTRTGRMSDERLRSFLPDFMRDYDAYRAA
ncbi:MAG: FAD-dependent monooxygenase [Cyanobacteria bacterium J06642_2]